MKVPRIIHDWYAKIGSKGGKKARHFISPAKQRKMQKARKAAKRKARKA